MNCKCSTVRSLHVLVLVDTLQRGTDVGIQWVEKYEMEQTPRFFMADSFLKPHIKKAETLEDTGSSLLGWKIHRAPGELSFL